MNPLSIRLHRLYWVILLLMVARPCSALEDPATALAATWTGKVSLGYRSVSTDHEPNRAASHSDLRSGPTAELEAKYLEIDRRFMLVGSYLSDADYLFEGDFDYKGLLRFNFDSESLTHNLDHNRYDRPDASGTFFGSPVFIGFEDRDATDDYVLKVGIDQIHLKTKLPDFPAHFTLGYWRLERTGQQQLRRFSYHPPSGIDEFAMISQTQKIDRVTEEVTLGLDGHFGYVNLAVEQLFREFKEREPQLYDDFGGSINLTDSPLWTAGRYPHDNVPDSRMVATTLKASTSPSGGLIAAADYTIGKKENLSDQSPYIEAANAETDFHKGSADLSYTPHPKLTLNFRYRMLDQNTSSPSQLLLSQATPSVLAVRESIDLEQATYFAKLSYRPFSKLTLMTEYEHKEIHRGQTGDSAVTISTPFDPDWELPDDELIDRYRIGFINRPSNSAKLRINGWYEILHSSDPAYGVSSEDQQQIFTGINWSPNKVFGLTANFRIKQGVNSNFERSQYDYFGGLHQQKTDRKRWQENFTFGLWSQVSESINLNLQYGYLGNHITQDLLLWNSEVPSLALDEDVDYRQRVHTATMLLRIHLTKQLLTSVEGRYVHSQAEFDSGFLPLDPLAWNGEGLGDLNKLDITQTGFALGLEWALAEGWSCAAKFSFDDYEDRNSSSFDGTAQMVMFNVARAW